MLAAKTGRTLTAVIEEALRAFVYSYPASEPSNKGDFHFTSWDNGELAQGVDCADFSKLLDIMDEGVSPEKLK